MIWYFVLVIIKLFTCAWREWSLLLVDGWEYHHSYSITISIITVIMIMFITINILSISPVPETEPAGQTVFTGVSLADKDSGTNSQVGGWYWISITWVPFSFWLIEGPSTVYRRIISWRLRYIWDLCWEKGGGHLQVKQNSKDLFFWGERRELLLSFSSSIMHDFQGSCVS